jgi:hypothetical protein
MAFLFTSTYAIACELEFHQLPGVLGKMLCNQLIK